MRSRVGGWVVTDLGFESGDLLYADVASECRCDEGRRETEDWKEKEEKKMFRKL